MKLVRFGPAGREKPGIIDKNGKVRDLSKIVKDIDGDALSSAGLAKIKKANTFLVAAKVTTTYTPSFGWASYNASSGLSFSRTPINMNEEIFLRPRIGSQVTVQ